MSERPSGFQHCFVACAEKFKREYSQVSINLVVENTRRCCQAVARGELDFAVVGGQIPPDVKHLLLVSACEVSPEHCLVLAQQSLSSCWQARLKFFPVCCASIITFLTYTKRAAAVSLKVILERCLSTQGCQCPMLGA